MKKTYITPEIEIVRFETEEVLEGVLVQSGLNQNLNKVGGFSIFDEEGNTVSPFEK